MDNQKIIEEFRANKGQLEGPFAHMKLSLLTTKGAKTDKSITIPVAYTMDGDDFVIVASKGGADTNPGWYYNLITNPRSRVEVGTESYDIEADEADEEERKRLFDQHANEYPQFWDYEKKTTRKIPVFRLKKIL
jgi:deazaflavin-dependent oxidoreductase (nitroreductase family)